MNEPLDLCRIAAESARDNELLDQLAVALSVDEPTSTVGADGAAETVTSDIDAEMIALLAAWRDDVRTTPSETPFFGLDTAAEPGAAQSPTAVIVLDPPVPDPRHDDTEPAAPTPWHGLAAPTWIDLAAAERTPVRTGDDGTTPPGSGGGSDGDDGHGQDRPRHMSRRLAVAAVTLATVVASASGVAAAATQAMPDSALWPISRLLNQERANSLEARVFVERTLTRASEAQQAGNHQLAVRLLREAHTAVRKVRPMDRTVQMHVRLAVVDAQVGVSATAPSPAPTTDPAAAGVIQPGHNGVIDAPIVPAPVAPPPVSDTPSSGPGTIETSPAPVPPSAPATPPEPTEGSGGQGGVGTVPTPSPTGDGLPSGDAGSPAPGPSGSPSGDSPSPSPSPSPAPTPTPSPTPSPTDSGSPSPSPSPTDSASPSPSDSSSPNDLSPSSSPDPSSPDPSSPDASSAAATSADASSADASSADADSADASSAEQSVPGTSSADAGSADASSPAATDSDATSPDTTSPDTTSPDTTSPDTTSPDTTSPDTTSLDGTGQPAG